MTAYPVLAPRVIDPVAPTEGNNMNELEREIAAIAAVTIALGVPVVDGCRFCGRSDFICPDHVGAEIARLVAELIHADHAQAARDALRGTSEGDA